MGKPPGVTSERLRRRGWMLLGLVLAGGVGVSLLVRSGFLADLRARRILKRAEAHLVKNELPEARRELREAIRIEPDLPRAREQLAGLERRLGDWELAFLEYQALTEMHPEDPEGWLGLADLMVRSGLVSAPEAALDSAIDASPRRVDAHRMRGYVRFGLGRYHGAARDAELAVAGDPTDVASWDLLVRSTARSRGSPAALEVITRAIASVGRRPVLVQTQAWLLADGGRAPEAVTLLDQELQTGENAPLRRTLARVQARAGNLRAARTQVDLVLASSPLDEESLGLRAALEAAEGQVETSLRSLEEALRLVPRSQLLAELRSDLQAAGVDRKKFEPILARTLERELGPTPSSPARVRAEAWMSTADPTVLGREHWPGRLAQMRQALEVRLRQQDWGGAEGVVEAVRRKYPGTTFAAFVQGILEFARGRSEEATKQLAAALAASPRSPVVLAALAKAWSREKGAAFAGDQLVRVADNDPGFAFARYLAARAYMDGREPGRAEAVLQRGPRSDRGSQVPYRHLALFYLEVDRTSDAVDVCRQGLERFPRDPTLHMTLAQLEVRLGRPEEAIRLHEQLLAQRPDLDLVEYSLGELAASEERRTGSARRSSELLRDLGGDRPSDPALLDTLGWMAASAGDTARARDLLEASVQAAPDEPRPRFHLATVYARESKVQLSRKELKTALESGRPFPERLEALRLLRSSEEPSRGEDR